MKNQFDIHFSIDVIPLIDVNQHLIRCQLKKKVARVLFIVNAFNNENQRMNEVRNGSFFAF